MIICDTGPLVALLNANDKDHRACTDLLERERGPIILPGPVLTEICYLTESRMGSATEAAFLDAVCRWRISA